MLPIKLKGMMLDKMQANILPLHTPSTPGGLKFQNIFSSESSDVAYQMNRKVGHAHTMIIYAMGKWGRVFYPVENSCLAYQYNTTLPKLPGHVAQLASSTADPWVAS